jgi:hypothetical protein
MDWGPHDPVAMVQCVQQHRRLKFECSLVGKVLKDAPGPGGEGADVQVSEEAGDPGLMAAPSETNPPPKNRPS